MSDQTLSYAFRGDDNTVTTKLPVTAKTANYTVDADNDIARELTFDTTSSNLTVSLPTASSAGNGFNVIVRNTGTGTLTIDPNGTETIDGELTEVLQTDEVRWIRCDGLSWRSVVGVPSVNPAGSAGMPNLLINGEFAVAQRGTSFDATTDPKNDDDEYLLDRWVLLSDGNDVVDVDQTEAEADLPTGARAAMKYTWETANKQAGLLQIVEGINARPAIGGPVSLSFQAKGTGLANLRAAVLAWDGTEDTVTADVVATWAGGGTNPTFATNWTAENTPANLALTTDWQTFAIENVDIDTASTTNIAVFIWLDDTDAAQGNTLLITNVKLEVGEAVTAFVPRQLTEEQMLCYRYYYQSNSTLSGLFNTWMYIVTGSTQAQGGGRYPVPMRTTPTVTIYGNNGNADEIHEVGSNDFSVDSPGTVAGGNNQGMRGVNFPGSSPVSAGDILVGNVVADAEL